MLMQTHRSVALTTPLGDDVLVCKQVTLHTELSRDFKMTIQALSEQDPIEPDTLLGEPITVRYQVDNGEARYFHGLLAALRLDGRDGQYLSYELEVRPWLWYLRLSRNCRIFQHKTVPDIVKEVFRVHGFSDFQERLRGTYRQRSYCVQYRESDFDFVNRLLENEGIYYYFLHDQDKHTLILADGYHGHGLSPGYEEVPFYPRRPEAQRERDHLWAWRRVHRVHTGVCTLNEFNFTQPRARLKVEQQVAQRHAHAAYEDYDYPGLYEQAGEGQHYVQMRMEELESRRERLQGTGNAVGLYTGALFTLAKFPEPSQNREYLLVSATHTLENADYESGAGGAGIQYEVCFSALDSRQAYRPPRVTPCPTVQGPQTAVVVGPKGEEIHTDRYGRVKVQFHWDRQGKKDANSSCWVRVAQMWAGAGWGAMSIPRIGQEVVIEFLEGDPDQPLITGRVYNADNPPPYGLPSNMTQMGIKSRSTKGAGASNFNELRFEDKLGSEEVYLQAEKDCNILVKNNEATTVGNNQRDRVTQHKNLTVGGDFTSEITQQCWTGAQRIVITAETEIYLQVGGNFISISQKGIILEGKLINLNCGNGPSPDAKPPGAADA